MFANDTAMAEEITTRCRHVPTKEDFASCVLDVLRERQHNKFFSVKRGDLRFVSEVEIIDEERYEKERKGPPRKKIAMTTTQGDYDPDYMNWYAIIESVDAESDALVLVKRKVW
ncbi:hypothetical protein ES703_70812 [subsurface metagenome]